MKAVEIRIRRRRCVVSRPHVLEADEVRAVAPVHLRVERRDPVGSKLAGVYEERCSVELRSRSRADGLLGVGRARPRPTCNRLLRSWDIAGTQVTRPVSSVEVLLNDSSVSIQSLKAPTAHVIRADGRAPLRTTPWLRAVSSASDTAARPIALCIREGIFGCSAMKARGWATCRYEWVERKVSRLARFVRHPIHRRH